MQNERDVPNDNLEDKIRTATKEILEELRLNDRVRVNDLQRQIDSARFWVGLTERTGPEESAFHNFSVEPLEALEALHGVAITVVH